jgi:hypothetical protein
MTNPIQIVTERAAIAVERETLTATISAVNAEQRTETWEITWRPQIVRGTHLGHENIGEVPIVWADTATPPAYARRSAANGSVSVRGDQVQVQAECRQVVEGTEVEVADVDDLEPGTYVLRYLGES